jgi:hypothetical protein
MSGKTQKTETLKSLNDAFRSKMPSGHSIAQAAFTLATQEHGHDVEWIKSNFSSLVEQIQSQAYDVYLKAESEAGKYALSSVFLNVTDGNDGITVLNKISDHFLDLDRFFLGLTQSRRPRAGRVFEYLLGELFKRLGYPYTARADLEGSIPDFVIPSIEHFKINPMDALIFTVKRTLRERWRQIVTEGTRGLGFFLATIDEKVAKRDLDEMLKTRIYLVVPERIKTKCYPGASNVITFEHFFEHYLDPAMKRWKAGSKI